MTSDPVKNAELALVAKADEIAALEPAERGQMITMALVESRQWLAVVMRGTDPTPIAEFKAWAATVAEMTRQKHLAREIQDDATEMVRRAERGIGVAIRNGQEAGEIETPLEAVKRASNVAKAHRLGQVVDPNSTKPRALDYASTNELHSSYANIMDMTDDVNDEQFEEALTEAREEGNLARVNVVRKINNLAGFESKLKRDQRILELALNDSMSSEQIAAKVHMHVDTVRKILRDSNVVSPADQLIGKTRRLDHDRIVRETVIGLEGTAMSLQMLDVDQLKDLTEIDYWVTSIGDSVRAVTKFHKQLKGLQ